MNVHTKRIFIGNLPPDAKINDVEERFADYGEITSVEIKQRKEGSNQDSSSVFAFVNIKIDERTLNKCFRELSDYDWNGYLVRLQLAKESFLERLKREREEVSTSKEVKNESAAEQTDVPQFDKKLYKKTYNSSGSESADENPKEIEKNIIIKRNVCTTVPVEKLDYVIKSNKLNSSNGKSIKIESFGASPLHVINCKETKKADKDGKILAADEKRKKSLSLMKHTYLQQKSAIKSALSSIDSTKNNKIIFHNESCDGKRDAKRKHEDDYNDSRKKNRLCLFEDEEEHEQDVNFSIKKQFEGAQGQKLLQLQSRFTNDKRFTLDSRFVADETSEPTELAENDEKQKQLEILESVLGKKVTSQKPRDVQKTRITMTRFDPSRPDHSKYEVKEPGKSGANIQEKVKREEPAEEPKVQVSKDTFYEVKGSLKQSLQEKQSFSLLSMFGRAEEKDETEQTNKAVQISTTKNYMESNNPFKYDSSDSEDETEEMPKTVEQVESEQPEVSQQKKQTFFFQADDTRLQEAEEFLRKLGSNDWTEQPFDEKRRLLKKIVRDKIRNNMRNHGPFRQKLGRAKMIKVKKAKNMKYDRM